MQWTIQWVSLAPSPLHSIGIRNPRDGVDVSPDADDDAVSGDEDVQWE